jgi:hypothetical protein
MRYSKVTRWTDRSPYVITGAARSVTVIFANLMSVPCPLSTFDHFTPIIKILVDWPTDVLALLKIHRDVSYVLSSSFRGLVVAPALS